MLDPIGLVSIIAITIWLGVKLTRRPYDKHVIRLPPEDRPIDYVARAIADRERE